jgi:hypothetical protein
MSWASKRQTTRVEDTAYCLMGIFDANMPLLYGEGNKAFTRLQEQIAKDSDDQTIFCWYRPGEIEETTSSFLASSPRDFQECSNYLHVRTGKVHPYEITNAGLRITGRLQERGDTWRLLLHCYDEDRPQLFVKLPLKRLGEDGDQFFRIPGMMSRGFDDNYPERTIYISKKKAFPPPPMPMGHLVSISLMAGESLRNDFSIEQVYPLTCWEPSRTFIYQGGIDMSLESLTNFSWHAAVKIRISSVSYVVAVVGYNGRHNIAWCELAAEVQIIQEDQSDLATLWYNHVFHTAGRESHAVLSITLSGRKWILQAKIARVSMLNPQAYTIVFDKVLQPQS